MYIFRLIVLTSLFLCFSNVESKECEINQICELKGTLVIYKTPPEFTAHLELADSSCVPIALSSEQYDRYSALNHQLVTITGLAFSHNIHNDVITYKYQDRWVGTLCSASYGVYLSDLGDKIR